MRLALIIIDALRYDHFKLMENTLSLGLETFDNHFSQSVLTEPSLTSILTGKYPQEHGIVAQALGREIPGVYFKNSFCMSPMSMLQSAFDRYVAGKYIEDAPPPESLRQYDFIVLHFMNVHDMTYDKYCPDVGWKLEKHGIKLHAPNPGDKNMVLDEDERRRLYHSTVLVLDEKLSKYLGELSRYFKLIITADHGENLTHGGHSKLRLETLHVPLASNCLEKVRGITEHVDLLRGLRPKKYSFAGQRHWARQESVTDGRNLVILDHDRGFGYFTDDKPCKPSKTHLRLRDILVEFSNSFKPNHVKTGRPRVEELRRDADIATLKRWLRGWGF